MREKSSSYLSERKYENGACESCNMQNLEYWKRLLDEEIVDYLLKNEEKFTYYLLSNDYKEKTVNPKKNLLKYLSKKATKSDIPVCEMGKMEKILFVGFYKKILKYSVEKLKANLEKNEVCCSEQVYQNFMMHLAEQLQAICLRTLIAEMHAYKQKNLLQGNNAEEEYWFFSERIAGDIEFIQKLFGEYPVLYRCVEEKIDYMVNSYTEIVNYFLKDKKKIQEVLCEGENIRRIEKITGNFSDTHNNGKQVVKIRLDNGKEILFKPRSMENEKKYMELLQWLSDKTKIMQYDYRFLTYTDHSWSSIVEYRECESEEQLKRYYVRIGVQLFLAYLLGTKDLHCENIIAAGEYPVLIDLETLVNISCRKERKTAAEEIYYQLSQSVLCTGLLPFYNWNQERDGIDASGINGGGKQQYPFKIPIVIRPETSEMHIEYQYPDAAEEHNRATLKGKFIEPSVFTEEVLQGYTSAYMQVMKNRKEFLLHLETLKSIRSRFLLEHTQRYTMLLSGSYHPSLLIDGAERELFFNTLWHGRMEKDKGIVEEEIKSLLKGDIPYFWYNVNSMDLESSGGQKIKNYFSQPIMDVLCHKVDLLTDFDMERQCEYIKCSLKLIPGNINAYVNHVYRVDESKLRYRKEAELKEYRKHLTDKILKYAVWNQEKTGVNWMTIQMMESGQKTWNIKPMNMYLYDGLTGMLLLMYCIKQFDRRKEIKDIFQRVRNMLFCYTEKGRESSDNLQSRCTGAYEGEASLVYTYLVMYAQTTEEMYLQYAKNHAEIVEKLLAEDKHYDLLSGNAGAAQVFVLLYENTSDKRYLDMAEKAIGVLEKSAQKQVRGIGWKSAEGIPPMAGMAHGNAGILMPVVALWQLTGKEKYEGLAEQIWEYEESLYNPRTGNWEDVRLSEECQDEIGSVAWCHGAAGILLSCVSCYERVSEGVWKERFKESIERAYEIVKKYWKRDSWTLCHGNCGNLWIMERAEQLLRVMGVWGREEKMCENNVWLRDKVTFLPQEAINPGVMNGYGGVLFYFLPVQKVHIPDILELKL